MAIYYLGTFPPEYGGVTIKNLNLYNALQNKINLNKVDFSEIKRKNIKELFKLIRLIINPNNKFIIGVAGRKTRKRFCKLLYYINRKSMKNSIILIMGGTASNDIANDPKYLKYVNVLKKIYVESNKMQRTLEKAGLTNVGYYPNGRFMPKKEIKINKTNHSKIKCLFFSYITPPKGVPIILNAAQELPDIDFYFYGKIDNKYSDEFYQKIKPLKNVYYNGIFSGKSDDVYFELNKYDILLLPTTCPTEGVPGILVESKIAGIPAIVSNHNFNAEIIKNGYDGIVMDEVTTDCLVKEIKKVQNNLSLLNDMKINSKKSVSKYFIENYVDEIADAL